MKSAIYARVSSVGDRQDTTRQIRDLENYAIEHSIEIVRTFEEHISGAKKTISRMIQNNETARRYSLLLNLIEEEYAGGAYEW